MSANRSNYQVTSILAKGHELSCDSWATGLNANQLVLGPSGAGKTRDFLKPNLMQMGSSFVVLDTKGTLQHEVGPLLEANGYEIQTLDFANGLTGNAGYDPMRHLVFQDGDEDGMTHVDETSVLSIATAIVPQEHGQTDPFWSQAACSFVAALILLAAERSPEGEASFNDVISLYNGLYRKVGSGKSTQTHYSFRDWASEHPNSRAVLRWNRIQGMADAEKMYASILGIVDTALSTFITKNAQEMYERPNQIDFAALAKKRIALFITVSDNDPSMRPMTNVLVTQAFNQLMRYADNECEGGRLECPVRFFLDDFSNLYIPNIDDILSVVRSREIWVTLLCQSVMQLNARYGDAKAASVIANCDTQLLLGFCDNETASFYSLRANKPASTLLNAGPGETWLFVRTRQPECVQRFNLKDHPRYKELPEAKVTA